jgi:hypothetical protein
MLIPGGGSPFSDEDEHEDALASHSSSGSPGGKSGPGKNAAGALGGELDALIGADQGEAAKLREQLVNDAELARLSLPEELSDRERLLGKLIRAENPSQRLSVFNLLPRYLACERDAAAQESAVAQVLSSLQPLLEDEIRSSEMPDALEAIAQVVAIAAPLRSARGRQSIVDCLLQLAEQLARSQSYGSASDEDVARLTAVLDGIEATVTVDSCPAIPTCESVGACEFDIPFKAALEVVAVDKGTTTPRVAAPGSGLGSGSGSGSGSVSGSGSRFGLGVEEPQTGTSEAVTIAQEKARACSALVAMLFKQFDSKAECLDSRGSRALGARLLGVALRAGVFPTGQALGREGEERAMRMLTCLEGLCQDVDADVRRAACEQIGSVSAAAPAELVKSGLWSEFLELRKDEEMNVRLAVLGALEALPLHVPESVMHEQLLPWFQKQVFEGEGATFLSGLLNSTLSGGLGAGAGTGASAGAAAGGFGHASFAADRVSSAHFVDDGKRMLFATTIARVLGPVILGLKSLAKTQLASADAGSALGQLLALYQSLARSDRTELRRLCAFNWPGVLACVGGANYAKWLDATFQALVCDDSDAVRTLMARSMHETAAALGKPRMARYGVGPLCALLADRSPAVRKALASHLVDVLDGLSVSDETQRKASFATLLRPTAEFLLPPLGRRAGAAEPHDWRARARGIERLKRVHDHFQSEDLAPLVLPVLLDYMREGAEPLRLAACGALAWLMRRNKAVAGDVRVIHDVKAEFCRGHTWGARRLFIAFVRHTPAFPGEFIAKYRLGEALMDLAEDKVANVRLQVWLALPELVIAGVVPLAQALVALAKAVTDEDRDVRAAAEHALAQLEYFDPSKLPLGAAALLPASARGTTTTGTAVPAVTVGDPKSSAAAFLELGASGLSRMPSGGHAGGASSIAGSGAGVGTGSSGTKKVAPRPPMAAVQPSSKVQSPRVAKLSK